jgi:M6 family metalloprotease-like protein
LALRNSPNLKWVLMLVITSLIATPLQAQYPRARVGEFEVRGFDFAQDGAWRRKALAVRQARLALLRSGRAALLNGAGKPAVRGNYFVPVIPVRYPDVAPPFASAQYQDLFFSSLPTGRAWSVKTFYAAASNGNISLDGHVFDWVTAANPSTYYQDGCNGIGVLGACPTHAVSRMGELLIGALDAISNGAGADTVWSRYDNDGPDGIPNSGDDDGVVDVVAFLQPTVDGACGTAGIWSHRGTIGLWNNGQPYTTRTPRRDAHGQPIPGQFLTVSSYTIQSAVGGDQACTGNAIMPIGTVTHETGHAFGLPDLYDTDQNSATQGAGEWSLMASGTYARPYSPSSFDAWSLLQLGWVSVDTLVSGATRVIPPVQLSHTIYYAPTATSLYYLLENRGAVGTDTAQMNPTWSRAKQPGLLVWQIDDGRVAQGLAVNRVNTSAHQGVALIQADGLDQLRTAFGGNRGDAGDSYPGSTANHDFGLATLPAATDWNGAALDVRLDHLALGSDGSVTLRYLHRAPSRIVSGLSLARIRVNGIATSSYVEVLAPGDAVTLSVDSTQLSFDGRSLARFLSWSDGAARDHVLIARAGPPDSITASFAISNRLRAVASGPGTITSSVAGVVGAGAFLDAAVAVHLVATPAAGAEFIGWRGDTTATASLDLVMRRPYDLTALFVNAVAIDPAVAARALLGGTPLSAAAAAYLDAIGNQNGLFDIGDYSAWLGRSGQRIPSALQRVGRSP